MKKQTISGVFVRAAIDDWLEEGVPEDCGEEEIEDAEHNEDTGDDGEEEGVDVEGNTTRLRKHAAYAPRNTDNADQYSKAKQQKVDKRKAPSNVEMASEDVRQNRNRSSCKNNK